MSKKIDRALNGPSWAEVILGAALSVVLGVALAALFFIFRPVAQVKELPKEPAPGVIYYLEGSHDSAKARRLPNKQKLFLQGGSVTLSEDELTTFAAPAPAAPPAPAKKPGAAPAPAPAAPVAAAAPTGMVTPGVPNFRIKDGVMHITVPVQVNVGLVGFTDTVLVQATGGFAKRGDTFAFVPDSVYVGTCPVQRLPMVVGFMVKKYLAAQPVPEHIANA